MLWNETGDLLERFASRFTGDRLASLQNYFIVEVVSSLLGHVEAPLGLKELPVLVEAVSHTLVAAVRNISSFPHAALVMAENEAVLVPFGTAAPVHRDRRSQNEATAHDDYNSECHVRRLCHLSRE